MHQRGGSTREVEPVFHGMVVTPFEEADGGDGNHEREGNEYPGGDLADDVGGPPSKREERSDYRGRGENADEYHVKSPRSVLNISAVGEVHAGEEQDAQATSRDGIRKAL